MKYASDFRRIAREALKGNWGIAVVAGLIASLLGASASFGPELNFEFTNGELHTGMEIAGQQILSLDNLSGLLAILPILLSAAFVYACIFFCLGTIISAGYSKFNLGIIDRKEKPDIGTMFRYFPHWKVLVGANLLKALYIFLWSLLFIIPGIVATYSYAMVNYILAENTELTAEEALQKSKEMMRGNRWRLFCLQFSFIGWQILSSLVFGIGMLWVTPYTEAATAAFYREVSGTAPLPTEIAQDASEDVGTEERT